ncbi:MAG: hypothetical protein A3E78_10185 [Alphaproteobacteria bacterium RIFCSPHIGHO2_12_FULL_63_12]|nr:MAG: hypothetical protein A3E78_10185 [Alphaproteobacteria bacterium RIFCSPHIGHO2_12_FULL_63_12]
MLPIFHQILGGVLVVSGAILTPTPIPFGLIMLTIGLTLLAPYMPPVQGLIRAIRRKWPKVDRNLIKHRHRFPPVIRTTIDKTHPQSAGAE